MICDITGEELYRFVFPWVITVTKGGKGGAGLPYTILHRFVLFKSEHMVVRDYCIAILINGAILNNISVVLIIGT